MSHTDPLALKTDASAREVWDVLKNYRIAHPPVKPKEFAPASAPAHLLASPPSFSCSFDAPVAAPAAGMQILFVIVED